MNWNNFVCIRLTAQQGVVSDGRGNYLENSQCSWLIDSSAMRNESDGADKFAIVLTITNFTVNLLNFILIVNPAFNARVRLQTECSWDHVYIYDGDSVFAPQLTALSGALTSITNARPSTIRYGDEYIRAQATTQSSTIPDVSSLLLATPSSTFLRT